MNPSGDRLARTVSIAGHIIAPQWHRAILGTPLFRALLALTFTFGLVLVPTAAEASGRYLDFHCRHGHGTLLVHGNLPAKAHPPEYLSFSSSVTYTGTYPIPLAMYQQDRIEFDLDLELVAPTGQGPDSFSEAQSAEYERDLKEAAESAGEETVELTASGSPSTFIRGRVNSPWEGWEPLRGRYDIRVLNESIVLPGYGSCALEDVNLPGFVIVWEEEESRAYFEQMDSTPDSLDVDELKWPVLAALSVLTVAALSVPPLLRFWRAQFRKTP